MALLHLTSNNPNFSYAISKNPDTGIIVRKLHNGKLFGFFSATDKYSVYYRDAVNLVSYKSFREESFEYMNTSRYNTPLYPIDVISLLFRSQLKGSDDITDYDQPGYNNSIELNIVRFDSTKYIDIFSKYFPDFNVTPVTISHKNYKIFIKTNRTITDLINYTALFMIFNILKNTNDYIEMNPDQMVKYIKCLDRLDAPYFMKYVFKTNLIRSPKLFKQYKETLEASKHQKIEMEHGSTNDQRLALVQNKLSYNVPICEIGCGEGNQTLCIARASQKSEIPVYAIDIDQECRNKVLRRIEKKDYTNVKVMESFEAFTNTISDDFPFEITMIEVIEHMEIGEATKLFKQVLNFCKQRPRSKLLLTTPNRDFNQFYEIDDYRHDDHKFEFEENMFKHWILENTKNLNVEVNTFSVGDKVNGIPTTLAVFITFNEVNQ